MPYHQQMAVSALGRTPTCLACLRRLAVLGSAKSPSAPSLTLVQTRGKTFRAGIRHDQGVVVRLLQDIPHFGPKYSIFRTQRGPMRNKWLPKNMAEYMTAQRFRELGLTRAAIGERNPMFTTDPAPAAAGDDHASEGSGKTSAGESDTNNKKLTWGDFASTWGGN